MDTSNIKIGVIGCGHWGRELVRKFDSLGVLKTLCDADSNKLAWYREHYPNLLITTSYDELLADNSIDGVVIAHSFDNHCDLARRALAAGKHVYLEKPLVVSEEEKKELLAIAKEHGRILVVGKVLRNHSPFTLLKEIVAKGELGTLKYIYSSRLSTGEIGEDESILWSFSPHDISMILDLAGQMPEFVAATGPNYFHRKVADLTSSYLQFPSGLRAHIFVSWLHSEKEQKLVLVGDKKIAVFQDKKTPFQKLYIYPHQISWESNTPVPQKAKADIITIDPDELLLNDCQRFLREITGKGGEVKIEDQGENILRVLNASQLSINQEGKKIYLSRGINYDNLKMPSPVFNSLHMEDMVDEIITFADDEHMARNAEKRGNPHLHCDGQAGYKGTMRSVLPFNHLTRDGRGCKIRNNISIYKDLVLESEVFCRSSQEYSPVSIQQSATRQMADKPLTVIKKGATLGANCTIARGSTVGEYAYIGAGAVVLEDVPPHALVVGNPARIKGWVCRCGNRLRFSRDDKSCCSSCLFRYIVEENDILFISGMEEGNDDHRGETLNTYDPEEEPFIMPLMC